VASKGAQQEIERLRSRLAEAFAESNGDAARELDKAADALEAAARHFRATNEANAALHLAETVRPSPLTSRVETAADEARRSAERFRGPGAEHSGD
jgi:hypothetical protein